MQSYSWSYKLLHWLMAVLLFIMFFALLGFNPQMSDADRTVMLIGHSSIGTVVAMLVILRITKRFVLKHEKPQHDLAPLQAKASRYTHYALYVLMVLVPVTGYMTANFHALPVQLFGSISLNGTANAETFAALRLVHSIAVYSLIGLVVLHVGAALMHKFVMKDNVLSTMRPWFARN